MPFRLIVPEKTTSADPDPLVFISKTGDLQFNKAASELYFTDEYKHFRLLYDDKNRQIGIECMTQKNEGTRPMPRKQGKNSGRLELSASQYFRQIGIDPKKITGRYPVTHEVGNFALVIHLKKGE